MADYGILIQDNLDGSFKIRACNRGTTTTSLTAGTDLLTDTTGTGFLVSASNPADGLGHKWGLGNAIIRALEICKNDRAYNG